MIIFDNFGLFVRFFRHLKPSSPKWAETIKPNFGDTSVSIYLNIFRLKPFRAFSLRGSLNEIFNLNSSWQFFHCAFRLQEVFTILLSSGFTYIPNSRLDVVSNGENCFSQSFSICETFRSKEWDLIKTSLFFCFLGRGSVLVLILGVKAACAWSEFSSISLIFVFLVLITNGFLFICTSEVAAEVRMHNLTVFQTVTILLFSFRQLLFFRSQSKSPNQHVFPWM